MPNMLGIRGTLTRLIAQELNALDNHDLLDTYPAMWVKNQVHGQMARVLDPDGAEPIAQEQGEMVWTPYERDRVRVCLVDYAIQNRRTKRWRAKTVKEVVNNESCRAPRYAHNIHTQPTGTPRRKKYDIIEMSEPREQIEQDNTDPLAGNPYYVHWRVLQAFNRVLGNWLKTRAPRLYAAEVRRRPHNEE